MINKRGRVLRGTNAGPGLLTVDGRQYAFTLEGMWTSEIPPQPGMTVDVQFNDDNAPVTLSAVSDNQIAREQAAVTLETARRHSSAAAANIVAKVGKGPLVAQGVLILGWFVFSFLTYSHQSETLWQLVGYLGDGHPLVSFGGLSDSAVSGSALYNLLALVSLAGPFLSYLWKDRRAFLGFLLPLAYLVGLGVMTALSVQKAMPPASDSVASKMAQDFLDEWLKSMSFGLGAYLSLVASLWLAALGIKQFLVSYAAAQPSSMLARSEARFPQG